MATLQPITEYARLGPHARIFFTGNHYDSMAPPFYVGTRLEHYKLDFPSLSPADMVLLVIELRGMYADHYDADAPPRAKDVVEAARRLKLGADRLYTNDDQILDLLAGVTWVPQDRKGAVIKRVKRRPAVPGFGWAAEGAARP